MKITQKDVDLIVRRAKELGASEGLTYKNGLWDINSHGNQDLEALATLLINGWHGKYDLIYAAQAALEFMESKISQ